MTVMIVQTKCKLNNTELFLKLFYIQCKEIGNNKCYEVNGLTKNWQQNLENGKVRFRLIIDVRKEMEDSRLNAMPYLTDYVRERSTEF